MIAESFEKIHLTKYRRGEHILNRLRAKTAINKVVSQLLACKPEFFCAIHLRLG